MDNTELIKTLILANHNLVDEIVAGEINRMCEYLEADLEKISEGGKANVFSLNAFEDYRIISEKLAALRIALEYFSPVI